MIDCKYDFKDKITRFSSSSLGISDVRQHAYHTCGSGSRFYYTLQITLGFLPYFIRFCQSIRAYLDTKNSNHLWNALKYFLSLTVTGLAVAHTAAMTTGLGEVRLKIILLKYDMDYL